MKSFDSPIAQQLACAPQMGGTRELFCGLIRFNGRRQRVSVKVAIDINGEKQEIELSDELFAALQAIAARNGLTLTAAIQQAILNENFIEDQQASGAKLLIEKDNKLREIVREQIPA